MHELQPKHCKLKLQEAKELLENLNVSVSQLPKIRADDPAIVDLKPEAGEIIKIERKVGEKTYPYYRVVI